MDVARSATERGEVEQLRERVAQLEGALVSRVVIEQAKGILGERLGLDMTGAFALLRYSARAAQLPLRELAGDVVASKVTPAAIMVGLAREQRWRAAAQRERAEAQHEHVRETQIRLEEQQARLAPR